MAQMLLLIVIVIDGKITGPLKKSAATKLANRTSNKTKIATINMGLVFLIPRPRQVKC